MKLLIVIVNYRTPALTIDTLASLEPEIAAIGPGVHTIVVDGKSPDDSVPDFASLDRPFSDAGGVAVVWAAAPALNAAATSAARMP